MERVAGRRRELAPLVAVGLLADELEAHELARKIAEQFGRTAVVRPVSVEPSGTGYAGKLWAVVTSPPLDENPEQESGDDGYGRR